MINYFAIQNEIYFYYLISIIPLIIYFLQQLLIFQFQLTDYIIVFKKWLREKDLNFRIVSFIYCILFHNL